jgi:2-amino-4-hydroxy-6-hydroxymethyldihydropteridine diphosphokinase
MNKAIFLLGSNLEDPVGNLTKAAALIEKEVGEIEKSSSIYITEPWGFEHKNDFYNQILVINTPMGSSELMAHNLKIEEQMGRVRVQTGYSARIIDIDILFYNEEVINEPGLTIPHPRIAERKFTLVPLVELMPGYIHPLLNKSIRKLMEECKDESRVIKYK